MGFRLLFVALIAFVSGLAVLQQSIWGDETPPKSAIVTFIGCSFLSAAIVLGTLSYLIIQLGWQDLYFPTLLLSPLLLGLSILSALGVYKRSSPWRGRREQRGMAMRSGSNRYSGLIKRERR